MIPFRRSYMVEYIFQFYQISLHHSNCYCVQFEIFKFLLIHNPYRINFHTYLQMGNCICLSSVETQLGDQDKRRQNKRKRREQHSQSLLRQQNQQQTIVTQDQQDTEQVDNKQETIKDKIIDFKDRLNSQHIQNSRNLDEIIGKLELVNQLQQIFLLNHNYYAFQYLRLSSSPHQAQISKAIVQSIMRLNEQIVNSKRSQREIIICVAKYLDVFQKILAGGYQREVEDQPFQKVAYILKKINTILSDKFLNIIQMCKQKETQIQIMRQQLNKLREKNRDLQRQKQCLQESQSRSLRQAIHLMNQNTMQDEQLQIAYRNILQDRFFRNDALGCLKQNLVKNIQSFTSKKIQKTHLLFEMNIESTVDLDDFIDKKQHFIFVIRTSNYRIAAYYSGRYSSQQISKQKTYLWIMNQVSAINQQNNKLMHQMSGIIYNNNTIIFGNNEIKISMISKTVSAYFDQQRKMQCLEIHKIQLG